jgi:hypothetical protein
MDRARCAQGRLQGRGHRDACRGIDLNGSLKAAWAQMTKAGVARVQSSDIAAALTAERTFPSHDFRPGVPDMLKPLFAAALSAALLVSGAARAQDTIKIGELNSYKAQPAFLEPYKKGWELAVEEVNAAGGVLGKKLQVVSRDDNGNPGDAVRVAEELVSRETSR